MKIPPHPTGWQNDNLAAACLDGLADAVLVVDHDVCVKDGNSAFFALASLPPETTLNLPLDIALQARPHLAPLVAAVALLAREHTQDRIILELCDPDSERRTVQLSPISLKGRSERDLTAVRIRDVSPEQAERATLESERSEAEGRARFLEHLNDELVVFSHAVAHDLRAPLRFIDKFAYLLMEHHGHELSSEALQYAEQIREASRQTAQLVEDLLHFSQLTGQELKRDAIDMTQLATQMVRQAQFDIEGRTVEFHLADLGMAEGDPSLVKQVLANLIGNAVKFTRPIARARIEIYVTEVGPPPIYTILDNGAGFDAAGAEGLFAVFQRFHQPEDFEGSGVGLAVAKRIVTRHGGSIWAESTVGHGARFHFTLAPALPTRETR